MWKTYQEIIEYLLFCQGEDIKTLAFIFYLFVFLHEYDSSQGLQNRSGKPHQVSFIKKK